MRGVIVVTVLFGLVGSASGDEGLWTFEDYPADAVRAAHGFAPDQAWLDRVRAATLSLDGCSASIVGSRGLVLTNHHCVEPCIAALAAPGIDMVMQPVIARGEAEERACPGQEAFAVTRTEDVTARIRAVEAGLPPVEAATARQLEVNRIVAECEGDAEDRFCEVAPLHAGGVETLYGYKKWTDVRLVLGPEGAAGSFGGDPDNFSFPRYAWDAAFLRLYENGAPAATPQRLRLRTAPVEAGEMVFVSGFPGETGREGTQALVRFYLDTYFPNSLVHSAEMRGALRAIVARGEPPAGFVALLAMTENDFKRDWTELAALRSPGFMDALDAREARLRADIAARPDVAAAVGGAFEEIEAALDVSRRLWPVRHHAESGAGGGSALAGFARQIVRAAAERMLPEDRRLPGYSDGEIDDLRETLGRDVPVFAEREEFLLSFWLSKLREALTTDHPVSRAALGRESPEGLARRAVAETGLGDPAERLRLLEGGAQAVAASDDPLIRLMSALEPFARDISLRVRNEVTVPRSDAGRRVNAARFALYGAARYPDAMSTLRLNHGTVAGWTEPDGREIAPFTRFGGLAERATGAPPYSLAPLWEAALPSLDPQTIFNISTTNDTIGGNSGSPALDREGRVVGAMFDGNLHSNGGYYMFDPALNRSVLVAATAILEGLSKVYGLDRVIAELTGE